MLTRLADTGPKETPQPFQGDKKLWAAVLELAILDAVKAAEDDSYDVRWLMGPDCAMICDLLDIERRWIVPGVLAVRSRMRAKIEAGTLKGNRATRRLKV